VINPEADDGAWRNQKVCKLRRKIVPRCAVLNALDECKE
jgi:hypothetical protein